VVGHLKTVFIVTSGIVFFGDTITAKKFLGIACAMAGIVWYTSTGSIVNAPPPSSSSGNSGGGKDGEGGAGSDKV
jgi:drug/metabolite transporter (DMT)-like permease